MSKQWYEANRDKVLAQKKAEYRADPIKKKAASAKYRADNKSKIVDFEKRRWLSRKGDGDYRRAQADRAREWYHANKDRVKARTKAYRLKTLYGLTVVEFEQMRIDQGGGCAICSASDVTLVVDHCHKTGVVRGLLCDACNLSIGRLGDTAEALQKAADYLANAERKASSGCA